MISQQLLGVPGRHCKGVGILVQPRDDVQHRHAEIDSELGVECELGRSRRACVVGTDTQHEIERGPQCREPLGYLCDEARCPAVALDTRGIGVGEGVGVFVGDVELVALAQ